MTTPILTVSCALAAVAASRMAAGQASPVIEPRISSLPSRNPEAIYPAPKPNPQWPGRGTPPACLPTAFAMVSLLLHLGLERVLDVPDLVELDVDELAGHLLDAADIDRLDNVAGFRIDRHR